MPHDQILLKDDGKRNRFGEKPTDFIEKRADAELNYVNLSILFNIKKRILAETMMLKLDPLLVSLAVGYATKLSSKQDIKAVMTAADNHMYKVKLKHGRVMRSQMIDMVLHNINLNYGHERIHTERVSHYCARIASAMIITEKEAVRCCRGRAA